MTNYCLGFLFSGSGTDARVALILKLRPEWQAGKLNGIGGKLEADETPVQAMRREFFEETGVEVTGWSPVAEMIFPDASVHVFAAKDSVALSQVRSITDEKIEVVDCRRSLGVLPNLRWLLPMAQSAVSDYSTFKPVLIIQQ